VVTTTGSGWVDPALVDSFEYLTGGDCATVAIQYSYLPSWISYLVDQSKALAAGRALFDAVYGVWAKTPAGQRSRLFVAGESLGSFGGEAAFTGENDLANRTSGALFAGPPNFNTLFREFSDHRDAGSPEVQPVYQDGRIVRFANDPATAIPPERQPWEGSRILYMMHPSDPIVWWSPHLIFSKPDWISEPPGRDVLKGMFWMPFVTFWQVTADLPFATGVPDGHGHRYSAEYVDGWNAGGRLRPSRHAAARCGRCPAWLGRQPGICRPGSRFAGGAIRSYALRPDSSRVQPVRVTGDAMARSKASALSSAGSRAWVTMSKKPSRCCVCAWNSGSARVSYVSFQLLMATLREVWVMRPVTPGTGCPIVTPAAEGASPADRNT
jgi:hypothetical protein